MNWEFKKAAICRWLTPAAVAITMSVPANAATILTIYDLKGEWTETTGGANVEVSGTGETALLSWGPEIEPAEFSYSGAGGFANEMVAEGTYVLGIVGALTYFNPSMPDEDKIDSATLLLTVSGTLDGVAFSIPLMTSLLLNDGASDLTCIVADGTSCPDRVEYRAPAGGQATVVTIGDQSLRASFTTELIGDTGPLDAFFAPLGEETTVAIRGEISLAPIPLPVSAWMLLSALAALGAASFRQRAATAYPTGGQFTAPD